MTFRTFLLERLAAWDPTLDLTDPTLVREIITPLVTHVGDELPTGDPTRLLRARLGAEFPDVDSTVFGDLFGQPAFALFSVIQAQNRMSLSRRRLDDSRVLAAEDLGDTLDVYLSDPAAGTYARGNVRVYFATPRAISWTTATTLRIPGRSNGSERIYYPEEAVQWSAADMRENRDAQGRYYVDVPIIASETGPAYNLDVNEARGCVGFSGAVSVTNLSPIQGGLLADDATAFQARIRSTLRYRALASLGGAEYALPQIGVFDFQVVQGGNTRMRRDRIFGVGAISGVPGGFVYPRPEEPISSAAFISLGLAYDIWVAPDTRQSLSTVDVRNLRDVGVETLVSGRGTLTYLGDGEYHLLLPSPRFTETVAIPEEWSSLAGEGFRPAAPGDRIHWEGLYRDAPGDREVLVVTGVAEAGRALLLEGSLEFAGPVGRVAGSRFSLYRPVSLSEGRTTVAIPLTDARALDAEGSEVFAGSFPAMAAPGTTNAESLAGIRVPRVANWVVDAAGLPVLGAERVELLDPITQQPVGNYVYPRHPLYSEFLDSIAGAPAEKLVRVRVHLLGPQATAFPPHCVFASSALTHQMKPAYWSLGTAETDPAVSETSTFRLLTTGAASASLPNAGGELSGRYVQPGDWVRFTATDGRVFSLPILTVSGDLITVEASDVPGGMTGSCDAYQGTSRAVQLEEGRGPEGTWSVDVWCEEQTAVDGYFPGNPPIHGTQAHFDPAAVLTQGFELLGGLPGNYFSGEERPSVVLEGEHGLDGQAWQGRSLRIHSFPAAKVQAAQALISTDSNRPIVGTGLVKLYAPTFLHLALYYDAEDLDPERAARAALRALEAADREDRLDLSDLTKAVLQAGADYVVTGRLFALQQDELRNWTCYATRDAVPAIPVGDLYLSSLVCTRILRRGVGEVVVPEDPANWKSQYILRPGGFHAD